MIDEMQGTCQTSSGESAIETAALKAYRVCKRGLAGAEFVRVDGALLKVEVSKVLELVAGPLVECGRAK